MLAIKIMHGLIFDGSGRAGYRADIGIKGGRIATIGCLNDAAAAETIEADGLCIAPGFIDSHSHSDDWYFANPYAVSKILQGVTTEIVGHCGESPAPRAEAKTVPSAADDGQATWRTVGEFREALEKAGIGVNVAMLAGHGTLRTLVMDGEARAPADRELTAITAVVRQAMAEGALGLSTGLMYPPGCYAGRGELTALAVCLRGEGGIYTSHVRSESEDLMAAVAEAVTVCAAAGVRGVVSHLKAAGRANRGRAAEAVAMLAAARRQGVDIFCDVYPYTALSTSLGVLLPPWAHEGGPVALGLRLKNPSLREALTASINARGADLADIVITRAAASEHRRFVGQALPAVAAGLGRPLADAVIELLAASGGEAGMIWHAMGEDDLLAVLQAPFSIIGSDAGARLSYGPLAVGLPHPRAYGAFPRFLARYVRDCGVLPLPAAIAKCTALPADIYRLAGRGRIDLGYWADVTIFDYQALTDNATYEKPFQPPDGIIDVLVNGVPAVRRGRLEYRLAGKFLTRRTD